MYEYPAMIYKSHRNNVYIANCMIKNLVGFGKTETDAIENLKESLANLENGVSVNVKPMYGLQINANLG